MVGRHSRFDRPASSGASEDHEGFGDEPNQCKMLPVRLRNEIPLNSMTRSSVVISSARLLPWLFRPLVRGLFLAYPYRRGSPHWVLLQLKENLGIRVSRRMKVDGFTIEADPFDGPGHTFWQTGLTEPETRNLLSRFLRPGMVMLDVGAYVGQFTLVASRATGDEIRIFAFEPTPDVFHQLRRNVQANHCSHVTCIQAALSDKPGRGKFYLYSQSHDQNSLRPLIPDARCVEVTVETIDAISEKHKIGQIDLIKIDVEGNEFCVLKGARQSLARFRPVLIIEVSKHQQSYGYTGAALKEFVSDLGYSIYRVEAGQCPPYVPRDDEINLNVSHFNIVGVPRERPALFPLTRISPDSPPSQPLDNGVLDQR